MNNTTQEKHSFSAKILLYGEYSIMMNSWALAIPYHLFSGELVFPHTNKTHDLELKSFAQYLHNTARKTELAEILDTDSFAFDVAQGLIFQSNIPQGMGLGSSGALCAAVLNRYQKHPKNMIQLEKLDPNTISQLKLLLSSMESHFHGTSSGIDPLISYLNCPLLIKNKNEMTQATLPIFSGEEKGGLFLLNTGRPRRTEPLVNLFLEKRKTHEFEDLCHDVLLPVTNKCITYFLNGDEENHYQYFCQLSRLQYEHFSPMIPKLYQQLWLQGLDTTDFALKLCGSGGGGYFLGMARDYCVAKKILGGQEIRPLFLNSNR